jgi:hypothetical protein
MMQSYDYAQRKGVRNISWDDFVILSGQLTEKLAPHNPQVIIGIARAGLLPATLVASSLRRELFPIRLTRRVNDVAVFTSPVWKVLVPSEVRGQAVAIIDEIADTGETLAEAAQKVRQLGARRVVTATLVSHTWTNPMPDLTALVTDEFVIFPWDRQVYADGRWQPHPEIIAGLKAQGLEPDEV